MRNQEGWQSNTCNFALTYLCGYTNTALHGTWYFVVVFKIPVLHPPPPPHWEQGIEFTPTHPVSLGSILIPSLSSQAGLSLRSIPFASGFLTKYLHAFMNYPWRYTYHPWYPPWFCHPCNNWWRMKFMSILIMYLSPSSILLRPT